MIGKRVRLGGKFSIRVKAYYTTYNKVHRNFECYMPAGFIEWMGRTDNVYPITALMQLPMSKETFHDR